jgi:hypothetical protein
LATWDASTFSAQLGKSFTVNLGSSRVALQLSQVKTGVSKIYYSPSKLTNASAAQSFVVIFHGPASPTLTQKTYTVQQSQLGTFSLFLIPSGVDATGRKYIATINHVHA